MVLLIFRNLPGINAREIAWIVVNMLISLPVLLLIGALSKHLRANSVRSSRQICIATAAVGLFWGSAGGVFLFPLGVAATLALFVIALVIFSPLPCAQIIFVGSFTVGVLVAGPAALPIETIIFVLLFSCMGIWVSAQTRFARTQSALALHRGRFARLSEQNGNFIWKTNAGGILHHSSGLLSNLLSNQQSAAPKRPFWGISRAEEALQYDQRHENQLGFEMLRRCHDSQSSFSDVVVNLQLPDGIHRLSLSGRPRHDKSGGFSGFSGIGFDLTASSKRQKRLIEAAQYDALTKLMNRASFVDRLGMMLRDLEPKRGGIAMLLIDLDKFKRANDNLGHQVGDQILRQFAERLCYCINSRGFVGRLGGDEFGVVLDQSVSRDDLSSLSGTLIAHLSAPYLIGGREVLIGASIGISIAPEHGETVEDIVGNADLALYAAKSRGGNLHRFFDLALLDQAIVRQRLEMDLKSAIGRGEMSVVYQAIVEMKTERVCAFEALARWVHPQRGEIAADEFIPLAETLGLIDKIGEWVLREACLAAAQWPDTIGLAVNISPLQLRSPGLTATILNTLGQSQLAPGRLELEITEGVFFAESAETQTILQQLNSMGVRWSLDDFGTGYSSLKYLLKAPFSKIKIDREFVSGMSVPGSYKRAIVGTIVALANILQMETTAEGVESTDDLQAAKELGCTQVQGFVFGNKLTAAQANALARSHDLMAAEGYKTTRSEPRSAVFRSAEVVHADQVWPGTVRNLSSRGAMIESRWNCTVGDWVEIYMDHGKIMTGVVRWTDGLCFGMQNDEQAEVEARERAAAGRKYVRVQVV